MTGVNDLYIESSNAAERERERLQSDFNDFILKSAISHNFIDKPRVVFYYDIVDLFIMHSNLSVQDTGNL